MSPRPDPAGTKNTDELAARRYLQSWLRPPYALDEREQHRQLDDGSTDNGARAVRAAALEEWRAAHGARYVLTDAQVEALHLFLDDKGPRPAFAWPYVGNGYGTSDELAAHAAAVAARAAPGPKEDPTEPGRYVQPTGRFALAGSEGFVPDSR